MDAVRRNSCGGPARPRAGSTCWSCTRRGYVLASFLRPLTNLRRDEYGGASRARLRFPLEVFAALRDFWPA